MKKSLFLILALVLVKITLATADTSPFNTSSHFEMVEVQKIYQLKDSLEVDSNLQFTISRFTYFELSNLELNSIIKDISNGIWPTYRNLGITYSETHYAYDESQSRMYVGKRYLAVKSNGYETEFIVFWVNPDKSRGKDE